MLYLNTSVLVPLVVPEDSSDAVERWFAAADRDDLVTSRWTVVEFASAIGNRERRQELPDSSGQTALEVFDKRLAPAFRLIGLEDADLRAAAGLLARFGLGLRSDDALHLAIAHRLGAAKLVTLDRRLAIAARSTGLGADEVVVAS